MPKRKFYALCNYIDKTDGRIKTGYLIKEGYDVLNDLGIKLAIYKTIEYEDNGDKISTWHVTDVESGLEVDKGQTKKEAIMFAIKKLSSVGMDKIESARHKVREQYGNFPGTGGTFLWGRTSANG